MRQRTYSAILILSLLIALPFAAGAEMTISPMKDEEIYYYEYWLSGPQIGILLPTTTKASLLEETPDFAVLLVEDPTLPDSVQAFFAIANPSPKDLSLEADCLEAINTIASASEGITYMLVEGDENSGPPLALSVVETTEGLYTEHYVALHDGWVLNAMVQKRDGAAMLSADERMWQVTCMDSAFASPLVARDASYTLPGSDITLTAPEGYYISISGETDTSASFSINANRTGVSSTDVLCTAGYFPALADASIATADADTRDALVDLMPRMGTGEIAFAPCSLGGNVALEYYDGTARHLIALRDGWGFNLALIKNVAPEEEEIAHHIQEAAMRIALGMDPKLAPYFAYYLNRVGQALYVPLHSSVLGLDIPTGYLPEAIDANEENVVFFLYDAAEVHAPIQMLVRMINDTAAEVLQQWNGETLFLQTLADANPGLSPSFSAEGPLGKPSVSGISSAGDYAFCWFIVDAHLVEIRYAADGTPLEAVLALLNLRVL